MGSDSQTLACRHKIVASTTPPLAQPVRNARTTVAGVPLPPPVGRGIEEFGSGERRGWIVSFEFHLSSMATGLASWRCAPGPHLASRGRWSHPRHGGGSVTMSDGARL
jgi:hypothetical protein